MFRECLLCQKHQYKCCFNPKPFLNTLDALILDVNDMALRSRKKVSLEPIKVLTKSGPHMENLTNTTSSAPAKQILRSISRKETGSLISIKERKTSENMDSFLFSLVPSKL